MAKKAKVHYTGKFTDGTEFNNSYKKGEPIEFIVGTGQTIAGFDEAVRDMQVGEKKTVEVPAAKAYGIYDETKIHSVPLENLPNPDLLPVGKYITFPGEEAGFQRAKVLKIEDEIAYFDFNHDLAGKDLVFEIELLEVSEVAIPNIRPRQY